MLNLGGTAPLDPFTGQAKWRFALAMLLVGFIVAFHSRPVRISVAILALGFIGGIVAGAI